MNILSKLIFLLKGFFFPSACALCSASLSCAGELKYGLCEKCLSSITTEEENKCFSCGKPLISEIELCLACRNSQEKSYERLWVVFPYTGKYRTLLAEYKFRKNLALAEVFTEKILKILNDPILKEAVIIPVPPRPGKIKDTGWDQVDYLVKKLKNILPKERFRSCLKRRKSKVQKKLIRLERIDNLKGRIMLGSKAPKIALVIDDVITTGSTMEVCASVLKEGGAEKVYGLCLFYD